MDLITDCHQSLCKERIESTSHFHNENTKDHVARQDLVHTRIVSITLPNGLQEGLFPEQELHCDDRLQSNLMDEIKENTGFQKSEGYWYCYEMMREIDK